VLLDAVATITGNTIVGGRCNFAPWCGPDWFNDIQAAAVHVSGLEGTVVTDNHISGSDIGVIGEAPVKFRGNTLTDNRDWGVAVVDVDAHTSGNAISGSPVGILVASISRDSSVLSSGDRISDDTQSATQTVACCGFVSTITTK